MALAMLRAFGQGSFPLVGTLLVARTFDAWRGRALSIAQLGSTLAAAALPGVAAWLIHSFGWRHGLQLTALAVLVVAAPLAVLVRWTVGARPPAARARRALTPGRGLRAASARARRFPWRDQGAVLLVALSASPLVSTAIIFHASSLLSRSGLSLGETAAALSLTALAGAGGALTGGAVVDRFGVRASVIAMNVLLAAAVGLLLVTSPAWAYAAFAVLGVASGLNGTAPERHGDTPTASSGWASCRASANRRGSAPPRSARSRSRWRSRSPAATPPACSP
jgi:MFS family permease